VPTVSGEIYFEECYHDNPLVNAMAVGIVKHNEQHRQQQKCRKSCFIVGSSTGKDGIHGATFASEEISEESESKGRAYRSATLLQKSYYSKHHLKLLGQEQ